MNEQNKITADHDVIRHWMEQRGARPAAVKNTLAGDDAGVLYVDFPGASPKDVDELSWETFFKKFDEQDLAFSYQDSAPDGGLSRDCALISRATGESVEA